MFSNLNQLTLEMTLRPNTEVSNASINDVSIPGYVRSLDGLQLLTSGFKTMSFHENVFAVTLAATSP